MYMKCEKQIIVYDDYNSKIYGRGDLIGTITTNIGNPSPRHGFRIVEILLEQSRESGLTRKGGGEDYAKTRGDIL